MTVFAFRIRMMASWLLWVVAWEIIGQFILILLFPPFSGMISAGVEVVNTSNFWGAIWLTVVCFLQGFGLAVLVGVPVGVAMGLVPAVDRLLSMWVGIFIATPLKPLVAVYMILLVLGTTIILVTIVMFVLMLL